MSNGFDHFFRQQNARKQKDEVKVGIDGGALLTTIAFIALIVAWFTHIITCLSTGAWGFLIAGALLLPVGLIHGVGIWFGMW